MALDTSKFTSDKEAGDGYRDYRKACQAAFKDINETLEPKPKINSIMPTTAMAQVIIDKVGACVGVDAEGNPIWTDNRAANLNPETIELYSFLVSPEGMAQMGMTVPAAEAEVEEQVPEVAEAEASGQPDPITMPEGALAPFGSTGPKFAEEGQECPGWVNKTGPNPQYKETCDACSRNEACAAQVVAKPAGRTKKTAEEKEAEKKAKAAEQEAKKQERAAARAANKTPGVSKPGVISTIVTFVTEAPRTKAEVVDHLAKTFPDRDKDGMSRTAGLVLRGGFKEARNGTHNVTKKDDRYQVVAVAK